MSKSTFVKYQGAGNDFILIDDRAFFFDPTQVAALCHRKYGIGADGVILLQQSGVADFQMRIFNSDGSEAESCGNGLRCLLRFLVDCGLPQKSYRIATGDRVVEGCFVGNKISIKMGADFHVKRLYIDSQEVHFIDTGVPHVVVFVPDVEKIDVMCDGAALRHHREFQPRGTNVNFAAVQKDGSIAVRTFERGLEGEPLACGTGATAVGVVAVQVLQMTSPIRTRFRGGEMEIQVGKEVRMVGDAVKVFEGVF